MAGTPAICTTIDTRTRELCQILKIPAIDENELINFNQRSISELFNEIGFKGEEFEGTGDYLAKRYINSLNKMDINGSEELRSFL